MAISPPSPPIPAAFAAAATTEPLPASTYDNGNGGVGATLIADANGALPAIDGQTLASCQNVLVKNQASALENGLYHVFNAGSGSSKWVLIRTRNNDQSTEFEIVIGVGAGTQAGDWWIGDFAGDPRDDGLVFPEPIIGTSPITAHPWPPAINHHRNQGIQRVEAGTTAALPASTYVNGEQLDGPGATLTADVNGALPAQDGVTLSLFELLLVQDQVAALQNGVYTLQQVGDGSNPWILRRHKFFSYGGELDGINVRVLAGTANGGEIFEQTAVAPVVGTDPITFTAGIGGLVSDETAIHDNIAGEFVSIDVGTVASADVLLFEDSDDADNKKTTTAQDIADLAGVSAHALGGASHTADTLANLNTKVSDGVLGVGYALSWGGALSTTGRFARGNGAADAGEITGIEVRSEHMVPKAGTLKVLAWITSAGDATTVIKIHKNSVVVETITLSGIEGTDATVTTTVVAGDTLAVEYDAGTLPGNGIYTLYIE